MILFSYCIDTIVCHTNSMGSILFRKSHLHLQSLSINRSESILKCLLNQTNHHHYDLYNPGALLTEGMSNLNHLNMLMIQQSWETCQTHLFLGNQQNMSPRDQGNQRKRRSYRNLFWMLQLDVPVEGCLRTNLLWVGTF